MTQNGLKLNSSPPIDQLSYSYETNSNRLSKVTDAVPTENKLGDFYNGTSGTGIDYAYDDNGNLTKDNNKGISSITYNHLNLPVVINIHTKGTITCTYDAAGNKHKKVTVENASAANNNITTTTYIGGMVYESKADNNPETTDYTNVLQFVPHEEGRIRFKPAEGAIPASFVYDYFIKDHLGNVRMVLTEEQQTIFYPAATLEGNYDAATNSMVNFEKSYYKIDPSKIILETAITSWGTETTANTKLYYNHNGNPPANLSYPAGCLPAQTAGSSKLYKVNATSNKTGLEFMIKVMAGDKIDIFGNSYYLNTAPVTNGNSTVLDLLGLMTNLLLSPENAALGKGISAQQLQTINNGLVPASFFRGNNSEAATTVPKAYINYIFFDEQFKYAGGGASRAGASGTVKKHWYADAQLQNITAPKNGYIFVYVSNESNLDVFFDNLQVIHKPGPILEETHYYPFGLTMAGISSRAAGSLINKYKFGGKELNSNEFSDGSGMEMYDFGARNYDPQIGRWHKTDNKAELYQNITPYAYAANQPTNAIDPDGNLVIFINGMHTGDGGKPDYWRRTVTQQTLVSSTLTGINSFGIPSYIDKYKTTSIRQENMDRFNDHKTISNDLQYLDGSLGGKKGLPLNLSEGFREEMGHAYGKAHVEEIINSLVHTGGVISETLKIVTHSMGGAYGKGFVQAIIEWAKANPQKAQGLNIAVYDFAPFQQNEMKAVLGATTYQFDNSGDMVVGYGLVAGSMFNKQEGVEERDKQSSGSHSIFDFLNRVSQLEPGKYVYQNGQFVRVD